MQITNEHLFVPNLTKIKQQRPNSMQQFTCCSAKLEKCGDLVWDWNVTCVSEGSSIIP